MTFILLKVKQKEHKDLSDDKRKIEYLMKESLTWEDYFILKCLNGKENKRVSKV